jgi:hypothetical protein
VSKPLPAADHALCVRVLSVILLDGTLPMPSNWSMHSYADLQLATPRLEGFFHVNPTPPAPELRAQIRPYAEKFGLAVTERPHGNTGLTQITAGGEWQGVELHIWGSACPDDLTESAAQEPSGSERV